MRVSKQGEKYILIIKSKNIELSFSSQEEATKEGLKICMA